MQKNIAKVKMLAALEHGGPFLNRQLIIGSIGDRGYLTGSLLEMQLFAGLCRTVSRAMPS